MSAAQRTFQTLLQAQAAGAGVAYYTDFRFDPNPVRTVMASITSGDSINILVSPNPQPQAPETTIVNEVWVTVATLTSVASAFAITFPVARIQAVKVGTAGRATVYGLV